MVLARTKLAGLALAFVLLVPAVAQAQTVTIPTPSPATNRWDGLNLLLTRERLRDIEAAVQSGDPLALQACADTIAAADHFLTQTPNPIVGALRVPSYYSKHKAEQQQITGQLRGDGRACLALAWGFALTGDVKYANKSKEFLFAWVQNLTHPVDGPGATGLQAIEDWLIGQTGGDTGIVLHYSFPLFLYGYDILNGLGAISQGEKIAVQKWLAPFIRYRQKEERFQNNHQNWQVLFLGCAAHVTEDQKLFDLAVGYYRSGMHHQQIAAEGAMWRELARGEKAATYTLMALEAMVQFVEIAATHGVTDLRDVVAAKRKNLSWDNLQLDYVTRNKSSGVASGGGNLRASFTLLRDFLNDPTSQAWTVRFKNTIRTSTLNRPADIADWGWFYEVGNNWWQDPSFQPLVAKAPYGVTSSERAYTLLNATLLFRPFGGVVTPRVSLPGTTVATTPPAAPVMGRGRVVANVP